MKEVNKHIKIDKSTYLHIDDIRCIQKSYGTIRIETGKDLYIVDEEQEEAFINQLGLKFED